MALRVRDLVRGEPAHLVLRVVPLQELRTQARMMRPLDEHPERTSERWRQADDEDYERERRQERIEAYTPYRRLRSVEVAAGEGKQCDVSR